LKAAKPTVPIVPTLTDQEKQILMSAIVRASTLQQRLGELQREAIAAEGAAREALRTILTLKGVNPDAYSFRFDQATGVAELAAVDGPA
jgi:hypothetical protein